MSPELAVILARLDLAYDNVLTTCILAHNLRSNGTDDDRARITNNDLDLLNSITNRLEDIVKREA